MLYVLYCNDPCYNPIYGVFDSIDKLNQAKSDWIEREVERMLSDPECGLDKNYEPDIEFAKRDVDSSVSIQTIQSLNKIFD